MNVSINEHVTYLVYSLIIGALLGALYDAVRLIRTFLGLGIDYADSPVISRITPPLIGKQKRREVKRAGKAVSYAAIFAFDLLYMLAATAVTVVFVYHVYSGTPRGFALIGEVVGFFVYMKTVGRLTAAAASYIFFTVNTIFRYIVFFTITPVMFVLKRVAALLAKLYGATIVKAMFAFRQKRAHAREENYINKDLKKMLAGIAEAIGRDGTE